MRTIIFDEKRFTRAENGKYYYNSSLRKYIHQYIWEKSNGNIPSGYEIHHKDFDTENNKIENLQLLKKEEHLKIHSKNISCDRKNFLIKNLNEKARPKAIEWHKSFEGREWHKKNYENVKDKFLIKNKFICSNCGKEFESTQINSKFCSNKCKSSFRRKSGVDNEERYCLKCGEKFSVNKYSKIKYCSRSCSHKK